jgi:ADP-ribose pyrophosphatase YjhB (NUDIX family)
LKHYHPQKNDKGQLVGIISPSQPSSLESWQNPESAATVTPGAPMPDSIGEIDIRSWTDCPADSDDWESLVKNCRFDEPPFKPNGKHPASGAVVIEPDGRVWVVSPSNGFGGYTHTAPKGKLDPKEALSLRGNALKEVYEEVGLHVELIGFLCDATRTTSTTRYYLARRLGGNPADMGWESQAVHLVPKNKLADYLTNKHDAPLLEALK